MFAIQIDSSLDIADGVFVGIGQCNFQPAYPFGISTLFQPELGCQKSNAMQDKFEGRRSRYFVLSNNRIFINDLSIPMNCLSTKILSDYERKAHCGDTNSYDTFYLHSRISYTSEANGSERRLHALPRIARRELRQTVYHNCCAHDPYVVMIGGDFILVWFYPYLSSSLHWADQWSNSKE